MMKEIPEYKGYYADTIGNVYSFRSGHCKKLSTSMHRGYYHVNVRDACHPVGRHKEPVHKLVLCAFVGPRGDGLVCRHLNGNALDNRLENLCWGTVKENAQDAIRHGTAACLRHGEQSVASKLNLKDVLKIRWLYQFGYKQAELAEMYPVT